MATESTLELRTGRLLLRGYRASTDLDTWAAMCVDPAVMAFLGPTRDRETAAADAERLQARLERDGFGWWALEVPGAGFVGYAVLQAIPYETPIVPPFEIGWRLAREHWGHGYATEAAARLLRFAFEDLDRDEVVAMTAAINLRSQAVMRRLGMTHDSRDDFAHPRFAEGEPLRAHVLYRARREQGPRSTNAVRDVDAIVGTVRA